MSYLDRRSNRSLSRRSPEQQQQHSPFGRRGLYDTTDDFEIPSANSPSTRSSPRHRRYTSQTGTLRGAFEATRVPTVSEEDDFAYARGSPSPSRNQMEMNYSLSPQSNPPEEIVEAYRRMREDHDLADPGDLDIALRTSHTSPGAGAGGYDEEDILQDPFMAGDEASFLDDVTDESPRRRKHADHVNDERRLRRATTSQSPVFSRAWTGTNSGLTSEDLQRHEGEDDVQEHYVEEEDAGEDDLGPKPSLNLPSTWGSRATNRRDWMRKIGQRSSNSPRKEVGKPAGDSPLRSRPRLDSSTNPSQPSAERSSRRMSLETRNALKERSTAGYDRAAQSDEQTKPATEQKDQQTAEGAQIPNTPISVYKNSTFNRRSPAKRDSQDLLRRLSRAESPRVNGNQNENQIKTPEPTKPFEGRIYDKTPIVTGAWIDTPMTEKVTELPEHLTKDIVPAPAERKEAENAPQPQRLGTRIGTQLQPIQEREIEPPREKQADNAGERKWNGTEKAEEKKEPEKTKPPVIKPNLPKSGLETLIRNSQANEDSQPLGDDTLESLEKLLEDENESNKRNGQPTEVKSEAEEDAAYEKAILKKLEGITPHPDGPVDLDQLHSKLESLSRNMNDLKTGFQGFEDRIKQDSDIISRAATEGKSSKHTSEDCKSCGAHNDGRIDASIPLPYLWRRDPVSRRIRPTHLAWCLSILILWLFSESTMCDYYCHPTYATVCEGNCLRPDAPQFPYVIPTMLWRWSHLSSLLAPVFTFAMAAFKFIAQLMGFWDGYVDDGPPRALDLAGEIRIRGTRIAGVPVAATQNPAVQQQQPWQAWHGQTYREERPESGFGFGQDSPPTPPPVHWGDEQSLDDDELL